MTSVPYLCCVFLVLALSACGECASASNYESSSVSSGVNDGNSSSWGFWPWDPWFGAWSWFVPRFPDLSDLSPELDSSIVTTDTSAVITLKGYKPGEVNTTVENGKLLVTGKHEEKTDGGYGIREVFKEISLPVGATADNMVTEWQADGSLKITVTSPSTAANSTANEVS